MPLDTQIEEYFVVARRETPPSEAPTWPAFAPTMIDGAKTVLSGDRDIHIKAWMNTALIKSLVIDPVADALTDADATAGAGTFERLCTASGEIDRTTFEVVSTDGMSATHKGAGFFSFDLSQTWRANYPQGQVVFATATVRAKKRFRPSEWLTWTMRIQTTGTMVVAGPAAPQVISQPANRTFDEQEGRRFTVNVAGFFDAPDVPVTYEVLNGDTSALTNFTLVSLISGVATIDSPTGVGVNGLFDVMFRVTDNSGRRAFVVAQYDVQADPAPQVIGGITSRTIGIAQSGTFNIDAANVFSDNGSLVYTVDQSNGSALPAGYSFAVNGTVVTITYPTEGSATSYTFRLNAQESGGQQRYARASFGMTRSAASTVVTTASPVINPEAATTPFQVNLAELTNGCPTVSITDDVGGALPNRFNVVQIVNGVADVEATYANNEILSDAVRYNGTPFSEPLNPNDTIGELQTAGWTFGTGWGVGTGDGFGGGNSIYSANANQTATIDYRPSASSAYSGVQYFALTPDAGKSGTLVSLLNPADNDTRMQLTNPGGGASLRVFAPYQTGDTANAVIDTATSAPTFDFHDGSPHLLKLTWSNIDDHVNGYIKLEEDDGAGNLTLLGEFTGDTNEHNRDPNFYRLQFTEQQKVSRINTDAPNVQVNTTWQSAHNPPVPYTQPSPQVVQAGGGPVVIDIVDLSDDPVNNLIVAGSVSADFGTISATTTQITYTPAAGYEGADTIYYTLEATSGGPQTSGTYALDVQAQAAPPLVILNISTTSTDGDPAPVINLMSYVSGGDGGALPSSFQFVDLSTGQKLGRTRTISGVGTFNITYDDNANTATLTPTFVSGFVGTVPVQGIAVADRSGNVPDDGTGAEDFIEWSHTQQADTTSPPPPQGQTIEPNLSDGLPIVAINFSQHNDWVGENIYKNRVHYYSLGDPVTGYIDMAPGDAPITIGQLWPMGKNGYTQFDQGEHVVKYTVFANTGQGGSANTVTLTFPGETESGSSGNVVRKVRTLGPSDTGSINLTIDPGANGGRIRVDFIGLGTYENDTDIWHPNFLSNASRYKIHRHLDWLGVNGGKLTVASEHIQDTDYRMQLSMGALPNTVPSPRGTIRAGYRLKELFGLAVTCNSAFWLNTPPCLGAQVVESEIWAPKSNQTDYNVMKTAIGANLSSILAQAEIEFRAYFDNVAQSAIDAAYPDQRVLIVELGNEPWNFGSRAFKNTAEYWSAIGGQLSASDPLVSDLGTGYGYVTALMARACKERFAIHKPNQQIVFVMNVQTGSGTNRNGKMRDAFNQYNASVSGGASMIDVFLGITSYIQGGFNWNNNQSPGAGNPFGSTSEAEFFADWQASHQAGEAAHFQTIKDWYLNATSRYKSVANVVNYHNTQLADAIASGMAGIIQYEGSFHDAGDKLVAAYPAASAAWNSWMDSTYSRDVLRSMIAQLRAINPTNPNRTSGWRLTESVINNYQDVHRNFGHSKPWVLRTPDQINTALTDHAYEAYSEILRGSPGVPPPAPPPTQPPATQMDEDFSVNDTIAKLGNAGWSMSGNDWQIEVQDGGKNVLRGTSPSNNAQYSFRQSLQVDPYLTIEVRLASSSAGQTGTIMRVIEQARNARFEMWNSGSEIIVSHPYIPGTPQTTLFTTGPGSNPAWASVGDIRDQAFKTLRLILEPNLVRLQIWNGSNFVTAGEATTNLDPNGVAGIWHALDLRYNRWFSHFKDLTP